MTLLRNSEGKFISKSIYEKKSVMKKTEFTNILIRMPKSYLKKIDSSLRKKEWGNRTQWIVQVIGEKLDENI